MTSVSIPTPNLDLVLQTPEQVLAYIETMPAADRAEVSPDWIARVRQTPAGDPFALAFSIVERSSGSAIGSCAFKGPPDADREVELAYGIDESHRCRGFATEAAKALAEFALARGRVRLVKAHTRPDNGASSRVLIKCGFLRVGEVMDPEDGLVVRWERDRRQD